MNNAETIYDTFLLELKKNGRPIDKIFVQLKENIYVPVIAVSVSEKKVILETEKQIESMLKEQLKSNCLNKFMFASAKYVSVGEVLSVLAQYPLTSEVVLRIGNALVEITTNNNIYSENNNLIITASLKF